MEYKKIYKEFIKNSKYKKMGKENHHGTYRLDHINRVAKMTYNVSKFLKLDYVSATRGALMHDFFLSDELIDLPSERLKTHPEKAYMNSLKYFEVNALERDIILSHMFPVTKGAPNYKESYIVSISDKIVSIYEFVRFQIKYTLALSMLFSIELLSNAIKII